MKAYQKRQRKINQKHNSPKREKGYWAGCFIPEPGKDQADYSKLESYLHDPENCFIVKGINGRIMIELGEMKGDSIYIETPIPGNESETLVSQINLIDAQNNLIDTYNLYLEFSNLNILAKRKKYDRETRLNLFTELVKRAEAYIQKGLN